MKHSSTEHVGLDVHKESIEIAVAAGDGGEVRHVGWIGGDLAALDAALERLQRRGSSPQPRLNKTDYGNAVWHPLQRIAPTRATATRWTTR